MENKGVELQLNSTLYESDDLKFDVSYNVSVNNNKITRLENEQNVGGVGFEPSFKDMKLEKLHTVTTCTSKFMIIRVDQSREHLQI